jgi:hypothetical protein
VARFFEARLPDTFSETFVYLGCMCFREWKLENTILLFGTIAWYMYACFTKWCGVCRVWCRRVLESKGNGGPCCDILWTKKSFWPNQTVSQCPQSMQVCEAAKEMRGRGTHNVRRPKKAC